MTPKAARFVKEYLVDLNATQAAIRAGYSERTAKQQGCRLLTKVDVQEALAAAQQKRSSRTEITAERVMQELGLIAFSDLRGLFTENGQLREVVDLPEPVARFVASVEVTKEKTTRFGSGDDGVQIQEAVTKVKVWDKLKAIELIGRHLAMWKDRAGDGDELPEPLKIEVTHRRAPTSHAG